MKISGTPDVSKKPLWEFLLHTKMFSDQLWYEEFILNMQNALWALSEHFSLHFGCCVAKSLAKNSILAENSCRFFIKKIRDSTFSSAPLWKTSLYTCKHLFDTSTWSIQSVEHHFLKFKNISTLPQRWKRKAIFESSYVNFPCFVACWENPQNGLFECVWW